MAIKSNLSSEQAAAIQRYCRENNAVLRLSNLNAIEFRLRDSDEIKVVRMVDLVYFHRQALEEEKITNIEERKRKDREAKWTTRNDVL